MEKLVLCLQHFFDICFSVCHSRESGNPFDKIGFLVKPEVTLKVKGLMIQHMGGMRVNA